MHWEWSTTIVREMSELGNHLRIDPTSSGFALDGEIDAHTAPALESKLSERLDETATITLDVANVTFMDSSGLRVLISITTACRSRGGDLIVESPGPIMRRLIEISGLADHLHLTDSSGPDQPDTVAATDAPESADS